MQVAGVILCGGKSSRMSAEKALLPVGDEAMLERMVRIVSEVCQPIVVVAAPLQALPKLPGEVRIVCDAQPDCGPLQGMCDGLKAVSHQAEVAFVTSCDAPLLVPALIPHIRQQLGQHDAAVPIAGSYRHPLVGVYRTSVFAKIEALLASGERSLMSMLDACDVREIPGDSLREVDPELASLRTCNHPDEYLAILRTLDVASNVNATVAAERRSSS